MERSPGWLQLWLGSWGGVSRHIAILEIPALILGAIGFQLSSSHSPGCMFSACHVSSALIDHHILAFSLTPHFYPVSLLRVIISNWQTKGSGGYLQVEAAWLASSVDSLCGHPPSLCLFHPPFISHSKEPSNSLPFQLKCCCSVSHVSMWAWYVKQDPQDGLSLFATASWCPPHPLTSHQILPNP